MVEAWQYAPTSEGKDPMPRVLVAQLGSRMHYAVPIAFHRAGVLESLVTDITADSFLAQVIGKLLYRRQPRFLRRLRGRVPSGLPKSMVVQFPLFGLFIGLLRIFATRCGMLDDAYVWIGRQFARRSIRAISKETNVVYGYNGASLELLVASATRGKLRILEQTMAPRLVEDQVLRDAIKDYPGWSDVDRQQSQFHRPKLYAREAAEWDAADVILCGSRFVVDGIKEAKGPIEKCVVIPYGIDIQKFSGRERRLSPNRPLKVLFVGAVSLRKGAPLLLEAARILGSEAQFRVVGKVEVPPKAEQLLRSHVDLRGAIPRQEIQEHYDWADVFLLPSFCEGSATVTYEAMASGLPQIITTSSGSYVRDGIEGKVVAPGDPKAIACAIRSYSRDLDGYAKASREALETIRDLTVSSYQKRLMSIVEDGLEKIHNASVPRS